MTTVNKADEQVLKTDELGRVRTPAARRENLIQEFERSGLSGAKFAALPALPPRWDRNPDQNYDFNSTKTRHFLRRHCGA